MHLSEHIDFVSATSGGLLIGLSSTLFLYFTGRITGISGIVGTALIPPKPHNATWINKNSYSLTYLLGLVGSGVAYSLIVKKDVFSQPSDSVALPIIAGWLVGFGSATGSGCTSGHGVCGLARLSLRSAVAIGEFMLFGAIGAVLGRSLKGSELLANLDKAIPPMNQLGVVLPTALTFFGLFAAFGLRKMLTASSKHHSKVHEKKHVDYSINVHEHLATLGCSLLFGVGLLISGMCNADKVTGFLDFSGPNGWDPSLMGVMGGGVLFNMASFWLMKHHKVKIHLTCDTVDQTVKFGAHPDNLAINWKLVLGAAIFGLGWGMNGVCPGPGLVLLGAKASNIYSFLPSMLVGLATSKLVLE